MPDSPVGKGSHHPSAVSDDSQSWVVACLVARLPCLSFRSACILGVGLSLSTGYGAARCSSLSGSFDRCDTVDAEFVGIGWHVATDIDVMPNVRCDARLHYNHVLWPGRHSILLCGWHRSIVALLLRGFLSRECQSGRHSCTVVWWDSPRSSGYEINTLDLHYGLDRLSCRGVDHNLKGIARPLTDTWADGRHVCRSLSSAANTPVSVCSAGHPGL